MIFLERITDEVHESRAAQDQKGPLLATRQELHGIRNQAQRVRTDAQESQAEIDQGAPGRQMPTARDACTTWYDSHEYEEEYEQEYEQEEKKEESKDGEEEEKMEEEDEDEEEEKYEEPSEDSDYDNYNDDDDARFLEWKTNGYMRTPNLFYSWQERVQPPSRDSIMQMYIDPKTP